MKKYEQTKSWGRKEKNDGCDKLHKLKGKDNTKKKKKKRIHYATTDYERKWDIKTRRYEKE